MSHDAVNHAREEYVRYSAGDVITTNTVEGYYGIFKRGMCTNTAPKSICTAIWQSSTSATATVLRWAWTIRIGPKRPLGAQPVSALPIGGPHFSKAGAA